MVLQGRMTPMSRWMRESIAVITALALGTIPVEGGGQALAPDTLFAHSATRPDTAGRLDARMIVDRHFHRRRRVRVYTPPSYDANRPAPYPLIIAFDGESYRDSMPLPRVLDSLAARGRTEPFVAVLVDDSAGAVRVAELGNSARMAAFMAQQLVPWVRRGWHVTRDPARVILTGSSEGGLGAAWVAIAHPELFGNVWAQSGAFWRGAEGSNEPPYEWLAQRVGLQPRVKVRFALDVGDLEGQATLGGRGPDFRDAARRFRDALKAKGHEVIYTEVPGGQHGQRWWRDRLAAGIVALSAYWPPPTPEGPKRRRAS